MVLLTRGVWGHGPPRKISNLGAQKLPFPAFSTGVFKDINMRKRQYYISSVISKVKCLQKKGQNSDTLKKVTSRGKDICPSDRQMHQNNAKDLSIILI